MDPLHVQAPAIGAHTFICMGSGVNGKAGSQEGPYQACIMCIGGKKDGIDPCNRENQMGLCQLLRFGGNAQVPRDHFSSASPFLGKQVSLTKKDDGA